jgi:serine/threonine protein kinase
MSEDFESQPWFKGSLSRDASEQFLKQGSAFFLVRHIGKPGTLCVSVRLRNGAFSHTAIVRTAAGWTTEVVPGNGAPSISAPTVRAFLERVGYLNANTNANGGSPVNAQRQESVHSASLKLAMTWGLSQLACFYTDANEENNLAEMSYLIRTSTTNREFLVLCLRVGATNELVRLLFRRVGNLWCVNDDAGTPGEFADFIRKVLPKDCVPHNDRSRVQQQRLQTQRFTENATIEQRAQNHSTRGRGAAHVENALLSAKPAAVAVAAAGGGPKSNYASVTAALAFVKGNDENVRDGTVWMGLARLDALAALNPVHDDLDGVSLASEPWYFFDVDTFGANAILAGLDVGSFLVRLNSAGTQFVVSFVREATKPVHVLLEVDSQRRTVATMNAPPYKTVRELVANIRAFSTPLSRLAFGREFADCTIELREKALGFGAGGVVLRGTLNGTIAVAVKRFRVDEHGTEASADPGSVSEAEAMLKIPPHPNVNRLYGLVLSPMALLVEFCDRGSLDQILGIDNSPGPVDGEFTNYSSAMVLSMDEVWQLARGIARGVAHLHQARVVHRDLATRNILVSSPLVPKVCDFGMSRLLSEDEDVGSTEERRGPIKWQAPEQLRGVRRTFSFKSDVFSFAVLLTEVVNNKLPWPGLENREAAIEVVQGERTQISSQCAPAIRSIIQKCWATNPDARPTMAELCAIFDKPMSSMTYETIPNAKALALYDDIGDI